MLIDEPEQVGNFIEQLIDAHGCKLEQQTISDYLQAVHHQPHVAEEVYTKIDVPAAAAASNKNFAHKIALLHDANS
jgi:hypothetical protein